jgi:hypothetical protein
VPIWNPWATSKTGGDTNVTADPKYPRASMDDFAAPDHQGNTQYITALGYAAKLAVRPSAQETPSAQRLATIPREDFRPVPNRPAEEFWRPIDADDKLRHSVETQDANGWTENKGQLKRAPDPRWNPPAEPRPTTQMAPRSYSFTRPFDQFNREWPDALVGSARTLNGTHFSMADHRRNYAILGMRPPTSRRNTYRLEPTPWDEQVTDLPPDYQQVPTQIRSVEVPLPSRSFRLG